MGLGDGSRSSVLVTVSYADASVVQAKSNARWGTGM